MRICVVGCGAVGSLFAANLANLEDVEVWAYDLDKAHVDAIKKNGLQLIGAGRSSGTRMRRAMPPSCPPCDYGIVATKAMHTEAASRRAPRFADGAVASVQNGVGNEGDRPSRPPRDPRHDVSGRKLLEPGVVQWDVKGDTTFGPFEPQPAATDRDRAARRCVHARRMPTSGGRRAARAVAQGDLQRGQQPDRGADRADTRARLRGPHAAGARLRPRRRGQGGRRRPGDRARRRSGGADRPCGQAGGRVRAQGVHAPGRRGPPSHRNRLPERRNRTLRARARRADAPPRRRHGAHQRSGELMASRRSSSTGVTRTSARRWRSTSSTR